MKWKEGTLGLTADEKGQFVELDDDLCLRWNVEPLQSQASSQRMEFMLFPNKFQTAEALAQQLNQENRVLPNEFASFKKNGFVRNQEAVEIDILTGKKRKRRRACSRRR